MGLSNKVRRKLKSYPLLANAYAGFDILRKHGSLWPEELQLRGTTHRISVNPREPRGQWILRTLGNGQPGLTGMWCRAVTQLNPDIVLDVGANYGEFLFAPTYPTDTRVIGVEANPALWPHLERSRGWHSGASQIEIERVAAGAFRSGSIDFFIHPRATGKSSMHRREQGGQVIQVPQIPLDDIVGDQPIRMMVFKIDVEGHEHQVLAGMRLALARCGGAFGIVEHNPSLIREAGGDPADHLNWLRETFPIIRAVARRGSVPVQLDPESSKPVDLFLAKPETIAGQMGLDGAV